MKLGRIALILLAVVVGEATEHPIRNLLFRTGLYLPDQHKAAQCSVVSNYLPNEEEHLLWSAAAGTRISDWVQNESGCKTALECSRASSSLDYWAVSQSDPNGDGVDMKIVKKWYQSDYCQNLVSSYKARNIDPAPIIREASIPVSNVAQVKVIPDGEVSSVNDVASNKTVRDTTLSIIEIRLLEKPILTEEGIHLKTDKGEFSMYAVNAEKQIWSVFDSAQQGQCLRLEAEKEFNFSDASGIKHIEVCK
jgi:hypothetical protein